MSGRSTSAARIQTIRSFNRFYTKRIGVLSPGFLSSPYSLTEVRILFELAHGTDVTAKELSRELELNPGYMSRTLSRLERAGLIHRTPSARDKRRRPISLTPRGRRVFAALDRRQSRDVQALLDGLTEPEQKRLVDAMEAIQEILLT